MINQGAEIQLNISALDLRNIKLNFRLNGAHYTHKMTKLPKFIGTDEEQYMSNGMAVGYSPYDWYLPEYAGINENGIAQYYGYYDKALGSFGGSNSADNLRAMGKQGNNYVASVYEYMMKNYPGKTLEEVLNMGDNEGLGKQLISGTDSRYAGSTFVGKRSIPDFQGGFGMDFEAYGFTLAITCSYGIGGYGYDSQYASLMHSDKIGSRNWHVDMRKASRKDYGAGEGRPEPPSGEACADHDERRPAMT
jgi:hypothetical protein